MRPRRSSSHSRILQTCSSSTMSHRRFRAFASAVAVGRIHIWTMLLLPALLLMTIFPAAIAEVEPPSDSILQGTLEGPILGVSCIPDAWLHLCQFPDSVVSVTSDTVPLLTLSDHAVRVAGEFYLCRDLFGAEWLRFEVKDAWSESCPIIAVSPASWGSIKAIYR